MPGIEPTPHEGLRPSLTGKDATTGALTVQAALGRQTGKTAVEMEAGRAGSSWADWIQFQKGIPENIATVMRLLTLDLERETAAEARLGTMAVVMESTK